MCFDTKNWAYFWDSLKYMAVILAVGAAVTPIRHWLMSEVSILSFALMVIVITLLYNLVFLALFHRTEEFIYLWNAVAVRMPILGRFFRGKDSSGKDSRKGDVDE